MVPSLAFAGRSDETPATPHRSPSDPHGDTGAPAHDGRTRSGRTLDLRRTEAPDPGVLTAPRTPHRGRHSMRAFDDRGRLGDRSLFAALGWYARMPVSIGVHDGGTLVVRRDPSGGSALTGRAMIAVPAPIRHWCGFEAGETVLLVAVPSLSALVIHGQEVLERLLPDPERWVNGAVPAGGQAAVSGTSPTGVSPVAAPVWVGYGVEVAGG
ncbi:hypothetical protein AB0K14_19600 [Actinosynnema sp. NPDC050801]|uniref:hypothetical protein n=1 Tax=unclassified Actinosynnema TaxID=2637065 RepID=UPI0034017026